VKRSLIAAVFGLTILLQSAGAASSTSPPVGDVPHLNFLPGARADDAPASDAQPSSSLLDRHDGEVPPGITTRVSVAGNGVQGNSSSAAPSISADGRFVAFESDATNLVSGDTNGMRDVFVHDREIGATARVSVSSAGVQGNRSSCNPSISADGRFVTFDSEATNLVVGDATLSADVFVHDRQTGETTLVSVASDGTQANRESWHPSISADGRYVAFESLASNLVWSDTGTYVDIFVHDRETGATTIVSVASDGSRGHRSSYRPSVSADGRYVAYFSYAANLVRADTNGMQDVFVHDRQTGETAIVSISSDGTQGDRPSWFPTLSADGRHVAFESLARNLVSGDSNGRSDIFVHDRESGATFIASVTSDGAQGNSSSYVPAISADGRYVAFHSWASNLVAGDTNANPDVFVHDGETGVTHRVSVASDGAQGTDDSRDAAISMSGRYVAFGSRANNLVGADTNECCGFRDGHCPDVFVRDRGIDHPVLLAAHLDIGMPYGTDRGCPSSTIGCGGAYHGFDAGVSTDLVMDAYRSGVLLEIQDALFQDHLNDPGRYRYGTARSAEDMRRYFQTNQQLLPHNQTYQVGDIVFFDWNESGLSNHVGIVTQVDVFGRPARMVHASGVHSGNPDGRASEEPWKRRYDQHIQGHGRLAEASATLSSVNETIQLLRITVDAPAVTVRLYDHNGRSTLSAQVENLIASNVEPFVPYIPGGQYADLGAKQAISVTQPLANADQYVVELTGQASTTFHLRIETLQNSSVTDVEVFTQTVAAGETHGSVITLSAPGGTLGLAATSPALAPHLVIPESLTLSGFSGTDVHEDFTIVETGGQRPLQNVVLEGTNLMNQVGGTVPAALLSFDPAGFTLAAGGSQAVAVQANLTGVEPGLYQGGLIIRSDNGATRMVPLTLEVQFHHVCLPFVFK
jgi:Tol biopolymer transport system component